MVANSLVLKRDVSSAEEFRVIVMRNERKKKRRVTIEESLMLISEEGAEILQDCVVINDSFHPFFLASLLLCFLGLSKKTRLSLFYPVFREQLSSRLTASFKGKILLLSPYTYGVNDGFKFETVFLGCFIIIFDKPRHNYDLRL